MTRSDAPQVEGGPEDPVAAGVQLIERATDADVVLRLIGGVAVAWHCRPVNAVFRRPIGDIDLATVKGGQRQVIDMMTSCGYVARERFNTLNGKTRLIFDDPCHGRQVDVFVGDFTMCHCIPLSDRLSMDKPTVPLAELLLMKLQVVEVNRKDLLDAAALVAGHEIGLDDDEQINRCRVTELTCRDWGLFTTVAMNLARLKQVAAELPTDLGQRVAERSQRLLEEMKAAPKSRAWQVRARLGTRMRWYELPEEP